MALADRSPLLQLWQRLNLGGLMTWWGHNLVAAVPVPLRWLFVEPPRALVVTPIETGWRVTREGLQTKVLAEGDLSLPAQQKALRQSLPKVLRLPREGALVRMMTLPLAAEPNLQRVIGFDLDRLTPFKANQVYFNATVVHRDRATKLLRVRLVVVPKTQVVRYLKPLSEIGFMPQKVTVEGQSPDLNLLPATGSTRRWRKPLLAVMGLVAITTLSVALLLPLWQLRTLAVALIPPVEQARQRAESVIQLRGQLEAEQVATEFLQTLRQARPLVVDVLRELTQQLPDDAFLEGFDLRGGDMQIQGTARSASRLLSLLESSPLFREVAFGSPTTQAGEGMERFQITLKLETPP